MNSGHQVWWQVPLSAEVSFDLSAGHMVLEDQSGKVDLAVETACLQGDHTGLGGKAGLP